MNSLAFKCSWHAADLDFEALPRYELAQKSIRRMAKALVAYKSGSELDSLRRFKAMGINPMERAKAFEYMADVCGLVTMFFRSCWPDIDMSLDDEENSHNKYTKKAIPSKERRKASPEASCVWYLRKVAASPLLDQIQRAKEVPDRRSSKSNSYRPKAFFKPIHEWRHTCLRDGLQASIEWKKITRPIIANYSEYGVIQPSYNDLRCVGGLTFSTIEEHRFGKPDLYFDFRHTIRSNDDDGPLNKAAGMENPYLLPAILNSARDFASGHPNAKFAVFRIWSAPHFWPLMIGHDNRLWSSFRDTVGRAWEWRFLPKDMPFSEWSIHYNTKLRLLPYKQVIGLGKKVFLKKDIVLVVGEDEEDLLERAIMVAFAITSEPWRVEIDLSKSIVNVDLGFLEGLDPLWWE